MSWYAADDAQRTHSRCEPTADGPEASTTRVMADAEFSVALTIGTTAVGVPPQLEATTNQPASEEPSRKPPPLSATVRDTSGSSLGGLSEVKAAVTSSKFGSAKTNGPRLSLQT